MVLITNLKEPVEASLKNGVYTVRVLAMEDSTSALKRLLQPILLRLFSRSSR